MCSHSVLFVSSLRNDTMKFLFCLKFVIEFAICVDKYKLCCRFFCNKYSCFEFSLVLSFILFARFFSTFRMQQIKVLMIFNVCLAFLLSNVSLNSNSNEKNSELFRQINGQQRYQEVLEKIEELKKNNGTINGVFIPSKDGYLGEGSFGVTYKGSIHYNKRIKK